jgi:hypothetical protein
LIAHHSQSKARQGRARRVHFSLDGLYFMDMILAAGKARPCNCIYYFGICFITSPSSTMQITDFSIDTDKVSKSSKSGVSTKTASRTEYFGMAHARYSIRLLSANPNIPSILHFRILPHQP